MKPLRTARTVLRAFRDHVRRHHEAAEWAGKGVHVSPDALVMTDARAELVLHAGVSVGRYTIINVRTTDRAAPPGRLEVGARTAILEFNNIRAGGGEVRIGRDCLISQYVTIVATNHQVDAADIRAFDTSRSGVHIGDGVWIGAGAAIMPGVRIEDGAIISAGAVVTRDVPARAIVGGVPARFLRQRGEPK
jgi:acetyltransferase-like isoleucine patch superfamily enzyme